MFAGTANARATKFLSENPRGVVPQEKATHPG